MNEIITVELDSEVAESIINTVTKAYCRYKQETEFLNHRVDHLLDDCNKADSENIRLTDKVSELTDLVRSLRKDIAELEERAWHNAEQNDLLYEKNEALQTRISVLTKELAEFSDEYEEVVQKAQDWWKQQNEDDECIESTMK